MERILEIQKFRNIGLNEKEKLVLNSSMKKGEIGNLIIVVGENNSGKSNVLDALSCFADKKFTNKDITLLSTDEEYRKPVLSLVTKDGKDEFSYSMCYGCDIHKINYPKIKNDLPMETVENDKKICDVVMAVNRTYGYGSDNEWFELSQILSKGNLTNEEHIAVEQKVVEKLTNIKKNSGNYNYQQILRELRRMCEKNKTYNYVLSKTDEYQILNSEYMKKYGFKFMPNILKYTEKNITNSDLNTSYQNISNNRFMSSLFKTIKFDIQKINNAYADYIRTQNNKGVLRNLSNEINKKLKDVAKKFNALYFLDDDAYRFEIECDNAQICFVMYRGKESISLDYQSTGFKWFFNLYFNLLASNSLEAGDIIIMDEPATNLSVCGQVELRKFLKEFAIKNDLTIIIATHSPFLIDIDYLDELRVVKTDGNLSFIDNDFSTINSNDPDSLKPVKKALTVGNHILFDPYKKVVFVEGITDYNYMVAFRKILKNDDIIFLPVNGIGSFTSEEFNKKQIEISKALINIKKHNPILMVDGDRAGKSIKNINKKDSELIVFTLSDIDEKFKNIEDLFTKQDLEKFGIKLKRSYLSSLFKTHHANEKEISKETLDNFKKVFDHIID